MSGDTCLNCGTAFVPQARFCHFCAQRTDTRRFGLRQLGGELSRSYLSVDHGVLPLLAALLIRPGPAVRQYLAGARVRYFGPTGFLLANVALASLLISLSGFQFVTTDGTPSAAVLLFQHNPNLIFFLQVPILALFSRVLFLTQDFNYAEHLVLSAYSSGMRTLFFCVVGIPVWAIFKHSNALHALNIAYLVVWSLYFGYAISGLMAGARLIAAIKGVAAVVLTIYSSAYLLGAVLGHT